MKNSFTIHDLPPSERPRERLQQMGADKLTTPRDSCCDSWKGHRRRIGGGDSAENSQKFHTVRGISEASLEDLTRLRGIGLAKAAQIKAAFELARRIETDSEKEPRPSVKTPEEVNRVVEVSLRGKKKEHFMVLLLDTRGKLIKSAEISVGSLDTSIVHPREVFKEALAASAASLILVHNHPSGDPQPSQEDIQVTKGLAQAGKVMGIEVLDHVIIGDGKHFSLKREGLF